jgi:FkbM family methyltransferase
MKIYYGILKYKIDVTDICLLKLTQNNTITIPIGDCNRANYFTDPLVGIKKIIMIVNNDNFTEYEEDTEIKIDIINNTITTTNDSKNTITTTNENNINQKINNIHSKLNINYGTFNDELPEQKMVVRYLTGNEKVLEIGGNIGRNALIIASILQDDTNLVTLETDINIAKQLTENRNLNNFNFHIENSALSNRKLIQMEMCWETIPSDSLQEGYNWVNTITFDELKNKYNLEFDTLVLDCEGAFYYILMDMPEILNNINLIIMENDYYDISKKNYVDEILKKNNFNRHYVERGGWGDCQEYFFEVWRK